MTRIVNFFIDDEAVPPGEASPPLALAEEVRAMYPAVGRRETMCGRGAEGGE